MYEQYDKHRFVLDNHCHVSFPQPIEQTRRDYDTLFESLHISEASLLSVPMCSHNDPYFDVLENLKVLYLKDTLRIPVYAWAGFAQHSDAPQVYREFALEMIGLGFDGFKSLAQHPANRKVLGKGLCDPSFALFFRELDQRGIPMVCHVGDPRNNWNNDTATESAKQLGRVYGEEHLSLDSLYEEMERVIRCYPNIPFVLAHFYFMSDNQARLTKLLEDHPLVCLDLTPGSEMYVNFTKDWALWRAFFIKWQDRIVLGSDHYALGHGIRRYGLARSFLEGDAPMEWNGKPLRPFGLPEETVNKICLTNAKRLLGPGPRPVDRDMAYAYCCRIRNTYTGQLSSLQMQNLEVITRHFQGA